MLDLDSLFKLCYGMYIVSANKAGAYSACIVNTVFQIVPEPPMLAMSLNKQSLTQEYIAESGVFAVSVLAEEAPLTFIGRFGFRSSRDVDKFKGIRYSTEFAQAPVILDYTATFLEVRVKQIVDIGTHFLFIAEITACQTLDDQKVPMTYCYYRDIKHGRTPRTAATYHQIKSTQG